MLEDLHFIKENGIAYSNEYPYISGITNEKDVCKSYTTSRNMVVEDFEFCAQGRCDKSLLYSMLQKGPIIVAVDADGGTDASVVFKLYTEGIIENIPCTKPTHAVVLIGSDYDSKGQYLTARNSWGEGWGEKGNFKIRVNPADDTCFMEGYGILPKVKMTTNPVPPPPVPGCLKLYSECGFKGKVREICENTPEIENFSVISGFDIGKFKNVLVYNYDENCRGGHYNLDKSFPCFSTNGFPSLENSIKSIIVQYEKPPEGCIWVFEKNCFGGEKLEICSDVPNLNAYNFGNRISSINFGPRVNGITVFLDINYLGASSIINREITGMANSWMDKDIESIRINKN